MRFNPAFEGLNYCNVKLFCDKDNNEMIKMWDMFRGRMNFEAQKMHRIIFSVVFERHVHVRGLTTKLLA